MLKWVILQIIALTAFVAVDFANKEIQNTRDGGVYDDSTITQLTVLSILSLFFAFCLSTFQIVQFLGSSSSSSSSSSSCSSSK